MTCIGHPKGILKLTLRIRRRSLNSVFQFSVSDFYSLKPGLTKYVLLGSLGYKTLTGVIIAPFDAFSSELCTVKLSSENLST